MEKIKIGIIEFGYHKPGTSSMEVLNHVIDYTVNADKLGFSRIWFTEHHDYFKTSPWSNPEVLLSLFLGMTEKIRIGMAGVLINYHSPYNVALNYKLLANLFPGRVDLGFANGAPPEYASKMIVQRNFKNRPKNFLKNAEKISNYFYKEEEIGLKYQVTIPPVAGYYPDMFLLASFFHSTEFALKMRLNYSKSLFHDMASMIDESEKVKAFRDAFYKKYNKLPQINICIPIICGKSRDDAKYIATQSGHLPVPNTVMGCIDEISERLQNIAKMFTVDEVIVLDRSFDPEKKI